MTAKGGDADQDRYMLDTCSFTELRRTYPNPPFGNVWALIERLCAEGRLLSIDLVLEELNEQDDEVSQWANAHQEVFLPLDEAIQQQARAILAAAQTLVDLKKKKSSADPFLIAAAIVHDAIVVTQEKPSGGPPRVKIPNVCASNNVQCIPLLAVIKRKDCDVSWCCRPSPSGRRCRLAVPPEQPLLPRRNRGVHYSDASDVN